MQMNSPEINAVLFDANNAQLMKKAVGLHDLYIPGEEDRTKQYAEFIQLSQAQPMPMIPPEIQQQLPPGVDPMTLLPPGVDPASLGIQMQPSVMPEPIDNHMVHMQILSAILNSPRGQKLKAENPAGYQNCMLHFEAHQMMMPAPEETEEGEEKPKEKEQANG